MCRITWCLVSCSVVMLMAAEPSWKTKDIAHWSVEDAQQVLRSSPWVKKTEATILPERTEAQQRDAGRMGGGSGLDLGALNPAILVGSKPTGRFASNLRQRRTMVVCWESAAPVRGAESKIGGLDAPTWEGDYYAIAVFGVPPLEDQKNLPTELRKTAFLRRDGKKDLVPARVDVIYNNEKQVTILFLFSRSAAITKKDRDIWFAAQIGQLFVEQSFDAAEMQFQGKLEL
jgi:hypothetical protein